MPPTNPGSVALFVTLCTLYMVAATSPRIQLRAATIDPRQPPQARGRKTLTTATHAMEHPAWGHLATRTQQLLTFNPSATHEQRQAVVRSLEQLGAIVSSAIPDDTLLLLLPDAAHDHARNSTHVLWLGDYAPSYKLAPELVQAMQQPPDTMHMVVLLAATVDPPQQRAAPAAAAVHDWHAPLTDLTNGSIAMQAAGNTVVDVKVAGSMAAQVASWIADHPAVHWVEQRAELVWHDQVAAAVAQSQQPVGSRMFMRSGDAVNSTLFPLWAAGLTGAGMVVGIGDSGLAHNSCYFVDPAFDLSNTANWQVGQLLRGQSNVRFFQSDRHRKIAQYISLSGDVWDSIGHGTHTSGSIAGKPVDGSARNAAKYQGVAPDARLAFFDLGRASSDVVMIPYSLDGSYFPYAYQAGAKVHSNSWGANTLAYDSSAADVDRFAWNNKDFLPVFAAGNFGDLDRPSGAGTGAITVTAPATCKNCISVGATPTYLDGGLRIPSEYAVHQGLISTLDGTQRPWKLVEANFGGRASAFYNRPLSLAIAQPLQACEPLTNAAALQGAAVVVQRGDCTFEAKARAVQAAGGALVVITDNQAGSYFVLAAADTARTTVTIPVLMLPRRAGEELTRTLGSNGSVTLSLASAVQPKFSYDNLAAYSSQGPTQRDQRIKPDILAVGSTVSAAVPGSRGQPVESFSASCAAEQSSGTSMSTPLVAGGAALLRQYFLEGFYPSGGANPGDAHQPSGALLKAVMLGGAEHLDGFEEDTGLPLDPVPSSRQGWGAMHLAQGLRLAGNSGSWNLSVVDGAPLRSTSQRDTYCVRGTGGPVRVTLVWWDPPASPSAAKALVNDLDLTVRTEDGLVLKGNDGASNDAAQRDMVNTVEFVEVQPTDPTLIAIQVSASVLAPLTSSAGTQPYALVVQGRFQGDLNSTANPAAPTLDVVSCGSLSF